MILYLESPSHDDGNGWSDGRNNCDDHGLKVEKKEKKYVKREHHGILDKINLSYQACFSFGIHTVRREVRESTTYVFFVHFSLMKTIVMIMDWKQEKEKKYVKREHHGILDKNNLS